MKDMNFFKKNMQEPKQIEQELDLVIDNYENKHALIQIENLTQIYQRKKKRNIIFENINFKIYENDFLAILGANGTGKTTIIEIIAGFKKPTSGKVIFNLNEKTFKINQIGLQFQDLSFPKSLKVKDILKFVANLDNISIVSKEFNQMLCAFKLEGILNQKVSKLSGGQQQRLNVIISLLNKPKILFLDEFSNGLDFSIKKSLISFILEYCKENKITLVIISHDLDIIEKMAKRIILLKDQKILIDAKKETIESKFNSLVKMLDLYI